MADYTSRHTGQSIDHGVQIALDWDPKIIGCKRVESTMSAPLDLDTFFTPGFWVVDYYTNGPLNLLAYTPLPFSVSATYDGSTLEKVTQSVDVETVKAYRIYTFSTKSWGSWVEQGFPKVIKGNGTSDNIIINDSTIGISDLKEITIQLSNTLNENAKITINGKGPYLIKMPDNKSIAGNTFYAGSFIKVIFSSSANAFYLIATPIPDNLADTLEQYGGRISGLEEKTNGLEQSFTQLEDQVEKNTDAIKNLSGGEGFAHIVDHSTDGQANKPWTKITFNTEGVVTKGEVATGSDIQVSSEDSTTIATKFENISKVLPDVSELEKSHVVVTDPNGKLSTSEMSVDQFLHTILFNEDMTEVEDVPD